MHTAGTGIANRTRHLGSPDDRGQAELVAFRHEDAVSLPEGVEPVFTVAVFPDRDGQGLCRHYADALEYLLVPRAGIVELGSRRLVLAAGESRPTLWGAANVWPPDCDEEEVRSRIEINLASVRKRGGIYGIRYGVSIGPEASVPPITEFSQREPVEGDPVFERTEVRLLIDDEALYIGAWLSTAGTGLYIVYNGAQRTSRLSSWGEPISRGFIIKYARQVRLF